MPSTSSSTPATLTRRDALVRVLTGTVVAAVATPALTGSAPPPAMLTAPAQEFVPENDYPFFGGEPPAGW